MESPRITCTATGCGRQAYELDPENLLPYCWDCLDYIDAYRNGTGEISAWDLAADGFRLGLLGAAAWGIFT